MNKYLDEYKASLLSNANCEFKSLLKGVVAPPLVLKGVSVPLSSGTMSVGSK
jgi:hypothetical protein